MYLVPSEFLDKIPEDFKKYLEKYPGAKAVLVLSDDEYTRAFHFNVDEASANLILDKGKIKILNGQSNGKGNGGMCYD
jgi:hypothetical protein